MRCNWVSFQLAPLIMYWTKERACMTFDREVKIPRFHHYNFKREQQIQRAQQLANIYYINKKKYLESA